MNLRYSLEVGRNKIINYLRREIKKGHYPGRHEIQEKLGIWFYSYFNDIKEPYNLADIDISKLKFNPFIATEKEKRLNEVVSVLLSRMSFTIIETYRRDGADILVRDNDNNLIPVELKAYHRNNNLPISNIFAKKYENEIKQLEDYIRTCKSPHGILITTTDRIRAKIPHNIRIISGTKLISLLEEHKLSKNIPTIEWIRNTYSSFDRKVHEDKIKKGIAKYVSSSVSRGRYPSMRDIERKFRINIRTYFENVPEIYKSEGIELPSRFLSKNEVKNMVADFIRLKVENGEYPSLEEIENRFKIRIRSYFKNPIEIYEYSNVPVPCKHLSKKDAIEIILKYCKEQTLKGKIPTIRQLDKKFHIDVYSYFKNSDELHKLVNM